MQRSFRLSCVFCALIGLTLALLFALTAAPAASAEGKQVSFINDVAPILKKNCFGCHDAKKKKGKFDMTTYANFRKGGRNDDPVFPGKVKASYLYQVLTAKDKSRMPPAEVGKPLPKEKIDRIARWIEQGAKLDKGIEATADLRRELRIRWRPPSLLTAYKRPALITALAFTPDGKQIIASGFHELTIWNVETGKLERRLHTRAERAHDIEFLKDGTIAVAGGRPGQEGDVRIYSLKGNAKKVNGVDILDGVGDKSVLLAELLQTDDEILTVDVSDDGKKLAAGGCDRLVRVWDISKGVKQAKLEQTVENHADWILGVNFSPNGKYLVTASRDKSAKIWVLGSKESLTTFPSHQEYVFGAVMSADNKRGISVGADRNLRTWNAEEKAKNLGKQIRSTGGHAKPIFDLAEYRDGKKHLLATCSADGTVRTWDGNSGKALKTFSGLKDWVFSVALSRDGKLVAGGGFDGEVRIWDTGSGKLIREFNASPGLSQKTVSVKKK